jgi:hypothetical protein
MVPSVNSGRPGKCQLSVMRGDRELRKSSRPNLASSAAYIASHIIASSKPPPRAEPATAAMMGLRIDVRADERSFRDSSASFKSAPAVGDMSVILHSLVPDFDVTYQKMGLQFYYLSKQQL